MDIEKVNVDERDTWAYWENKFAGMTQEDIERYWKEKMEEATSDDSILMDFADGVPGIRANLVREAYEKYMTSKANYDKKNEDRKDVERGVK